MTITAPPRRLNPWRWITSTIEEPRLTTVLSVSGYGVLTVMAWFIFHSPGPRFPETVSACVLLAVGGIIAVPAAWAGAWWAEGPAAAMQVAGLVILATVDSIHELSDDHWDQWPGLLVAAFAFVLAGRIARVWGRMWAPGRGPVTPGSAARVRAEVQVARAVDVMEAAQRREEEAECTPHSPVSSSSSS